MKDSCFGKYKSNCACINCEIGKLRSCKRYTEYVAEMNRACDKMYYERLELERNLNNIMCRF